MDGEQELKPIENLYNSITHKYVEFLVKDHVKNKPYDMALLDRFAASFERGSLVCDAGCGPEGHIGKYLFDKGLKIVGIDISHSCIESARSFHPDMEFRTMDFCAMDFRDDTIDGIIAFYSVIHIPAGQLALAYQQFNRVLKRGGRMLLAVHKGEGESIFTEFLGCKTTYLVKWYTENELGEMLRASGFAVRFMEARKPYDFEVQTERIYAIAEKI